MRRVIAMELVGLKKLDCDLYDENGNVVYIRHTEFTPEIFMMLTHSKVFKRDEEQLVEKNISQVVKMPPLRFDKNATMPEPKGTKKEYESSINANKKEFLIKSVKEVLKGGFNKESVKVQVCIDATEMILEEVYEKFSKATSIGELRVYDYYTFSHSINVAILSAIIGKELGFNDKKLKDLTFSALLHDVGKMQVPPEILYKPASLNQEEMQVVKKHVEYGYDFILSELNLPDEIAKVALLHHERWEGQGYPYGLKGDQIPEFAQIVGIADVYDALVSEKVYKTSVESIEAMKIMLTEEALSFNPEVLNAFIYMGIMKADSVLKQAS